MGPGSNVMIHLAEHFIHLGLVTSTISFSDIAVRSLYVVKTHRMEHHRWPKTMSYTTFLSHDIPIMSPILDIYINP